MVDGIARHVQSVTLLAKPADALAKLIELGLRERWSAKDVELVFDDTRGSSTACNLGLCSNCSPVLFLESSHLCCMVGWIEKQSVPQESSKTVNAWPEQAGSLGVADLRAAVERELCLLLDGLTAQFPDLRRRVSGQPDGLPSEQCLTILHQTLECPAARPHILQFPPL
jgi:hypothetical protein